MVQRFVLYSNNLYQIFRILYELSDDDQTYIKHVNSFYLQLFQKQLQVTWEKRKPLLFMEMLFDEIKEMQDVILVNKKLFSLCIILLLLILHLKLKNISVNSLMMSLVLLNRHSKILDIVESSTYNNRPGVSMQEI